VFYLQKLPKFEPMVMDEAINDCLLAAEALVLTQARRSGICG
jgi:hypothetical protein